MLYSGFNILHRPVFWSADFNGRSDNLDVILLNRAKTIRFRFRISSLLILLTISSLAIAYWSHQRHRQAGIVATMQALVPVDGANNKNPITIVVALNELKQLGHSDAVNVLRRFDKKYITKNKNVLIAVQLLFERKNTNKQLPSNVGDEPDLKLGRDKWHSNFTVVDGIPFATNVLPVTFAGPLHSQSDAIDWADENGLLIRKPLQPTNNPFKTCDKLIPKVIAEKTIEFKDAGKEFIGDLPLLVTNRLQEQVYQMVKHLVPNLQTPIWGEWAKRPEFWKKLKDECLSKGLQWSPNRNSYIFTK